MLAHSERVFLLLNKADELAEADRSDVMHTLESALAKQSLATRLAHVPMFVSAKAAWDWVAAGLNGPSPLQELESEIWDYLLTTNATGVSRLENAVHASLKAIDESSEFLRMRRATAEEVSAVQSRLTDARKQIVELRQRGTQAQEGAERVAASRLAEELEKIPQRIASELRAQPSPPKREQVSKRVVQHVNVAFTAVWENAGRELELHAQHVSAQLEEALGQVRLAREPTSMPRLRAPTFEVPLVGQLAPEAWSLGVVGGLLAWSVAPAYAAMAAFGSFLVGAWLGKDKQREREIAKIEREVRKHMREYLGNPARELLRSIAAAYERLDRYVQDRWGVFANDAQTQLVGAGKQLSEADTQRLNRLAVDLASTRQSLEAIAEEIRWSPSEG